jgi:ATP-dependent Zn protease
MISTKMKVLTVAAVLTCSAGIFWLTTVRQGSTTNLTYSQFLEDVRAGRVSSVVVVGNTGAAQATLELKDGKTARTVLPSDYKDALRAMQDKQVGIEIRDSSLRPWVNTIPFFLLLGVWAVLMFRKPNGLKRVWS